LRIRPLVTLALVAWSPVLLWTACSDDDGVATTATGPGSGGSTTAQGGSGATGGTTTTGGAGGMGTGGGTAGSGAGIPPPPTELAPCQGKIYACGDLVDNDMDGLIDYQDPDCLGPCDNTEDSLFGGIPGQTGPGCTQDCYFDQDSGAGNDDCYWNHKCDPNEVSPNYYPEPEGGDKCEYDTNANTPGTGSSCAELLAMQSQDCLDYCAPLTPNGCDCFGCCELPADSGKFVWLGSEGVNGDTFCTMDKLTDPVFCHPCIQVPSCVNDCKPCELCIGKTTLPPECFEPDGGMGGQECPPGIQQCGIQGQQECPSGFYCLTGCCQALPT